MYREKIWDLSGEFRVRMEEDRDVETLVDERESEKFGGQDEAQEGSVAIRKGGVMVTDGTLSSRRS